MQLDFNETRKIQDFVEESYLDYAMYVILDRALPSIIDGLKPVQRRIIYAMAELSLRYTAKHKKAARTVGDVLGKFHPHGESACYDAMVLMAQPFSSRYPLIEGQGNFGTADDPKSFAAMRYTEAKLSKYAEILLAEIDQGAVIWHDNFDGSLKEPKFLPAKLPMVLLNGTTGIAVGMATDLLPHNLGEIANACIYLLSHKAPHSITVADLCNYVIGPDFPTNAEIITTPQELLQLYTTGTGIVKARAVYTQEKNAIVITALPYMVSGAKVLKQIADQIHSKNLQLITDLRDESDHENPTRLVLIPKSNKIDVEAVMLHLFATTELEKGYRVNFNMIGIDGRPKVKNLLEILTEWLQFRLSLVKTSLNHKLTQLNHKLEIIQGLLSIYLNIDLVIKIIRFEDDPKISLIKKFNLTEIQANAILDLKLRNLAKIEEIKLQKELALTKEEQQKIIDTLNSEIKLKNLVKNEIKQLATTLGDPRRSMLSQRKPAQTLEHNLGVKSTGDHEITIILSDKGWVRSGKGWDVDLSTLNYKAGESYKSHACGLANQLAIFLDSSGKAYSLNPTTLPSMRGFGEPLTSKLSPASGDIFEAVILGDPTEKVLLAQTKGFGFITPLHNLQARTKTGKNIINLKEGKLLPPIKLTENNVYGVLLSDDLHLLLFKLKEVPLLDKGRGNKLCNLKPKQKVLALIALNPKSDLLIVYGKQQVTLKHKELLNYLDILGSSGKKLPKLPKLSKNIEEIILKETL